MIDETIILPVGAMAPDVPASPFGFDLLDEIGRGGMGLVCRARDAILEREVAVKLLQDRYAADPGAVRRFLEEARITGRLQHPGIPAIYQVGKLLDGRPFLAMKLIEGRTLDELIKAGAPVDPLAVVEAVGNAVGYAHARGIIHRDLKPANVMVGPFGEVQVMDWGLAKVLTASRHPERPEQVSDTIATTAAAETTTFLPLRDTDDGFTRAGSVLGTPAFMAPEQAAGRLDLIGTRSDVFGLGAILCVLLTGRPPHSGDTAEEVRLAAARGDIVDVLERLDVSGSDPGVVALCKRCLTFDPADRPATADEVAAAVAALRRAADDRAAQAERDKLSAVVRATEQAKRRRTVQRAAGAVAAVLLLGVAGTTAGLVRADYARDDAVVARKTADVRRKEAESARHAAEARRIEAEGAKDIAQAREAEAKAVLGFFENHVFAAGRPKGYIGGLGKDVTLRDAIAASLPFLDARFKEQPLVEAQLRYTLGSTFAFLGDYQTAVEQTERATAIFTERHGPAHPATLSSVNNLAAIYRAAGRHAEALTLHERTLATRKRTLGPDDPYTLSSMQGLAISYSALGRHHEALTLREETLAAHRRLLGPDHPMTLSTMHGLANSYFYVGRSAEALKLYEQTLAASKRVLGPQHPHTLDSMHNLANSYAVAGQHDKALTLREETLAVLKQSLGEHHPDTLSSASNLAVSYHAWGRNPEAITLLEETLAAQRRVLGNEHPQTLVSVNNLAVSYSAAARYSEALKLHEETLALRRRKLGPDHSDTLVSMLNTASCLVDLGRGTDAVQLIDDCVTRAAGRTVDPQVIPRVMELRLRHFQKTGDAAGCRATAAMWEALNRPDANSLYTAACMRSVAADLHAKAGQPAEATADADRAMAWLADAVAAGFTDRSHMEQDADLNTLRGRADFRMLLDSLPRPPVVAPRP